MKNYQYGTKQLILRTVTDKELEEVARTWPYYHRPVSETEAKSAISRMCQNYEKNGVGCIYHLCLAVCGKDNPKTIMGWCGLDGRRSHTEQRYSYCSMKNIGIKVMEQNVLRNCFGKQLKIFLLKVFMGGAVKTTMLPREQWKKAE